MKGRLDILPELAQKRRERLKRILTMLSSPYRWRLKSSLTSEAFHTILAQGKKVCERDYVRFTTLTLPQAPAHVVQ